MTHDNLTLTLCGSARFEPLWHAMNLVLTVSGHTVFSLTTFPSVNAGVREWYTDEEKAALDSAHRRKIDRSDGIVVLNRHAYIGPSTANEIGHARATGKRVYVLESWGLGHGVCGLHFAATQEDARAWGIDIDRYGSPLDMSHGLPSGSLAWFDLLGPAGALRSANVERIERAGCFGGEVPHARGIQAGGGS